MRRGCVRSPIKYDDASVEARKDRADAGACPVMLDLKRPVTFLPLRNLTGNDLTLCWHELCQCSGASDRWHGDSGAHATTRCIGASGHAVVRPVFT